MGRIATSAILTLAGIYFLAVSLWLCLMSLVFDLPVGEWVETMSGWYTRLDRRLRRNP